MSSIAPFATFCIPHPQAGDPIDLAEADSPVRVCNPFSIDHADAELHVEDYDAFPAWEPSVDELDAMYAAWLARESERGEVA